MSEPTRPLVLLLLRLLLSGKRLLLRGLPYAQTYKEYIGVLTTAPAAAAALAEEAQNLMPPLLYSSPL